MHTEYIFTQDTYKNLQKRRLFFYGGFGIIGLVGVVLFAILYMALDYNRYLIFLLIPSLIFAGAGLLYFVMILVMIYKLKDTEVKFTYDFNKEMMNVKSYSEGKLTSNNHVYYNIIQRYKDTGKNLFLYLPNKKVLPLSATDPKIEEIKKIININDIPKKRI